MRKLAAILGLTLISVASADQDHADKVHNMDRVDVKVDVRSEDIQKALRALKLAPSAAAMIELYFYDTQNLDLFNSNLILRGRASVEGDSSDITVKIRPAKPEKVDADWFDLPGFKCEYDETKSSNLPACSLKEVSSPKDIFLAAKGKMDPVDLLSKKQKKFAEDYAMDKVPWSSLKALGPVDVLDWDLPASTDDVKVSVELWTLPQGYQFLEISERVEVGHQDAARAKLLRILDSNNLRESDVGENKTEFVMRIFRQTP